MGKKRQTIGFWYSMGLHMGAGRGPVDELAEIRVGGLTAWDNCVSSFGNENAGSTIQIKAENLFGGDQKEGGVLGPLKILWGGPEQLAPAGMATDLGGDVPGFRGTTTFYFDGKVCAINPYPKEWSFRVRRARQGWWGGQCWYPAKARIGMHIDGKLIVAMNPAHILYEIATNPEWGRGLPESFIDENSFTYAANLFCAEGLGLCLPWFRQEDISTFTQVVIDHIGAAQYVSRETGKLTLRPIRDDYDVDDLPVFTPTTGLVDVINDDQSASDTGFNEIIINGLDPIKNEAFGVRVHNLAAIQSVGSIISNTIEYKGLPTRELALRKASSELRLQVGVRKPTILLDRRGWKLTPGMPFRVQWPARGIDLILRAGQVTDGTHENGQIEVKAVQDVFKMPETTYADVQPSGWIPPSFEAAPPSATKLVELPYREFYQVLGAADLAALTPENTGIGELATAPVGSTASMYELVSRTSVQPDYEAGGTGAFSHRIVLPVDLAPLDTSIVFVDISTLPAADADFVGDAGLIDNEYIVIEAFNRATKTMTIGRGVMDTIPTPHLATAVLWLADDDMMTDGREYAPSEIIFTKALTRTSTSVLAEEDAVADTITLVGRQARPYAPADVRVETLSIFDNFPLWSTALEPEITWAERNRVTQGDVLLAHDDASTTPEVGQTYTVRFYSTPANALLHTVTGIVGGSLVLDGAIQTACGNPSAVRAELEAVRDGLASYQHYSFIVVLASGWGYGYGQNYGGHP